MRVEIKKVGKTKLEIGVECEWEEFSEYYNKSLEKMSQGIVLDGFRTGKVPKDIVEQKIGQGEILEKAVELALQTNYPQIIHKEKLEVIDQPQVEILKLAKGNDFGCRIRVEVLPEVSLPDYKKIAGSTKKKEIVVTEEEINNVLNQLGQANATFEDLSREAQKGDWVEIEYQSPQIEQNKIFQDKFFLGKGQLILGFEENLAGMKKGEGKEFTIDFPPDYPRSDLAGQKVDFKVRLQKNQMAKIPEINDEFAKKIGRFDSLLDLKENIRKGLHQEKKEQESQDARTEVLKKIVQQTEIEIPDILLAREKEKIAADIKQEVTEKIKIPFEEYVKRNFQNEAGWQDFITESARNQIQNFLVLRKIGQQEKIEVGDKEIEEACNQFLAGFPQPQDVEKQIDPERLKSYYKGVIYNEKVFQLLENYADSSNNH